MQQLPGAPGSPLCLSRDWLVNRRDRVRSDLTYCVGRPLSYKCILIDPPWPEYGGGRRGAQNHYNLLSVPEIAKTIMRAECYRPAEDCHLWIWSPREIWKCLAVIDALGFAQKSFAMWQKRGPAGLGQYMRYRGELLLLATRGQPSVPETAPENMVTTDYETEVEALYEPRVKANGRPIHSRKPSAFYGLIESVSPGPRLEMFSRGQRDGWDAWGNEVNKFTTPIDPE
jgi:N6-adenosine-specific RNA methylase IME4